MRGQESGYIQIMADGDENSLLEVRSAGSVKVSANQTVAVEAFTELTAKVVDPETENESGIKINKDELTVSSTYGDPEHQTLLKRP